MDHTFSLNENLWIFTGAVSATTTVTSWETWDKPKWCRGIIFTVIGGGAGGGGGGASAAGVAAGGGGGGSGGTFNHAFFPAFFLPDRLYVAVGLGGTGGTGQVQGGAAATIGNGGSRSVISSDMQLTAAFIFGSGQPGVFGGAASGSTAGLGGSSVGAGTTTTNLLSTLGIQVFINSDAATNGGSSAAGVAYTYFTSALSALATPGTGGGGVNAGTTTSAGGDLTGSGNVATISGGVAGGGNGNNGFVRLFDPMFHYFTTGGTGGGANTSTLTGGKGGDGGYGSGGGGGGASNGTASIGGAGGRGGSGIIFIQAI